MLHTLTIDNVVLIDHQVVELGPGFNVLTGETGAGKSMVVDALALVLGGRAQPQSVRTGEREAEVAALFEIEPGSRIAAKLDAAAVPCDGELVIRRVVQAEGRSRAFLNGKIATAAQLAELAPDLCDIASQHESVSLTDPATHLEYLDAFGKLDALRDALGAKVAELQVVVRDLARVHEAERDRAEREDFLAFQLREIEELDPRANEEEELASERARLRHAEKLQGSSQSAADRLYEGEDNTVCDQLARIASDLDAAAAIDPSLAPIARSVDAARTDLADAGRALARYAETIESSPSRLAEVDDRWFRLQKLLRKHGPTTTELLAHQADLSKQLAQLASSGQIIEELSAKREVCLAAVSAEARKLSRKRRDAAATLAAAIGRELTGLGMGSARVIVDVSPVPGSAMADLPPIDGGRLTPSGIDRVEFMIAPNKGEDPRPLRKIASGGELSRALLALKRVLAEKGPAGLYVFDEVDAGVSGAIAEVIGRAIADVARHRQVLCITHLPQIAALCDHHFVIDKTESKGRTTSSVRRLSNAERVDEVARMIGGVKVGDAARRAAKELIDQPRQPRQTQAEAARGGTGSRAQASPR